MIAAWMLSAMFFTALLGSSAMFAERALRGARRQARLPWLVALGAGVTWPILAPVARRVLPDGGAMHEVAVTVPSVHVIPDALPASSVVPWVDVALLTLWAVASVVVLARLIHALVAIRRIRSASHSRMIDDVPVLVTDAVGPAVVGVMQPRVLLPSSLLDLDAPLRRLILRHELEHCRTHDQLEVIGSAFALALVPWNLPLWWTARRTRLAIEVDCECSRAHC